MLAGGVLAAVLMNSPLLSAEERPVDEKAAAAAQAEPADHQADKAVTAEKEQSDRETKKREFRGRLPAYFGHVVDEEQRQRIYSIQLDYYPRIQVLKKQLEAMTAERDAAIRQVITDQQWEEIQRLREEARQRRAKAKQ
jgi:hypothetical protein